MGTERRRQLILAVLAVVLVIVVYEVWPRTSTPAPPASNPRAATSAGQTASSGRTAPGEPEAPDVHLEALSAERPKPEGPDRNLFRFKPKAPPPPPPSVTPVQAPVAAVPTGPPPPPPLPPINLKFLGVLTQVGDTKIAVLSDGTGGIPLSGKEGDLILGRYRIMKIGVESIELAYADGRGRQTIRLTGS
jgi:hypothetical protein